MVIRGLLWLLLLCLPGLGGAVGLYLLPDKTSVELGKPLRAELFAVGVDGELDRLDLAPLRERFGVEVRDDAEWLEDERWPGAEVERLRMTLYPRVTGEQSIPPLTLGGSRSKIQAITVREGSKNGQAIRFDSHLSTNRPWQRQQVILWAEVDTPESFARLTVDEDWHPPGFELIPLPPTRRTAEMGTVLGIGWLLFPLLPGEQRLDVPSIAYRVSGRVERRYYPGITSLQVRALPPYVPPTMPVGRPLLVGRVEPEGPLPLGALAYWNLKLRSDALTPRRLPSLREQIHRSTSDLRWFSGNIERGMAPDRQGVHGSVALQVPFKPLAGGRLDLPGLQVDYFDPDTGRLERLHYQAPRPWVYRPLVLWSVATTLLLGFAWLLWRVAARGLRAWRRLSARRRVLAAMAVEESPYGLRLRIKQLADVDGLPVNQSLRQWGRYWQNRYRVDDDFGEVLRRLSDACYGDYDDTDFQQTRARLIDLLGRRRRLHRYPRFG